MECAWRACDLFSAKSVFCVISKTSGKTNHPFWIPPNSGKPNHIFEFLSPLSKTKAPTFRRQHKFCEFPLFPKGSLFLRSKDKDSPQFSNSNIKTLMAKDFQLYRRTNQSHQTGVHMFNFLQKVVILTPKTLLRRLYTFFFILYSKSDRQKTFDT